MIFMASDILKGLGKMKPKKNKVDEKKIINKFGILTSNILLKQEFPQCIWTLATYWKEELTKQICYWKRKNFKQQRIPLGY